MKRRLRFLPVLVLLLSLLLAATVLADFTYVVQSGDTLYGIAARFGTNVPTLVAMNNISNPNYIYVGQELRIPGEGDGAPPAGDTPSPSPAPSTGGTYVVRAGDTLYRIAAQFGTNIVALAAANNITNMNYIYVGQVLTIPGGGSTGSTPPPSGSPPPPITTGSFELGGQATGLGQAERMRYAGMNWVKYQHKWSPGDDPSAVAGRISDAHNNGFKVLLSIPGANLYPQPGSIDFNAYASFLGGVAALGPDAIEVWNEQNIDREWPAGQISPQAYVNNVLRPAYTAIKAANPNVMVISGAPSPTGFDNSTNAWADNRYISGMAAAGAANYADCIGVHFNAGATSPTVSSGHSGGSHYSWYYTPMVNLYYNAFGGSRKLCFTELGYLSGDGFPGISDAFGWARGTSVSEHAQWLAETASLAANSGRVRLMIVFNVDFTTYDPGGDPQAGYAMIRPDGSCPACDTLHAVTGGR
ncbi:MAG: LysM peptidoglycan-binding domain-containing protein [Anaerolineae bacterium]|nr:LysM peptidoglycan-binding domain-containing protein [Anaerolineae bacterium]